MNFYSDEAKKELDNKFSNKYPLFNFNVNVKLTFSGGNNICQLVHVSRTDDINKTITDAACLVADEWLEQIKKNAFPLL